MDSFDIAILDALQRDGSLTNAQLGERVHLSPSQCSRRRTALEKSGFIERYAAILDTRKLGFTLRAITRVNLRAHGQDQESSFARFLQNSPEVRGAFSVSGDADYVLDILVSDLAAFAEFIHNRLLPHPQVIQVRSEIILQTLKDRDTLDLH